MRAIVMLFASLWVSLMLWIQPALAAEADLNHGAQLFQTHCTACHVGGGNVVDRAKTLKLEDLEKYGMNSSEAIQNQVSRGKNAMPAFLGRLSADDIEDVAAYVLAQAEKGW